MTTEQAITASLVTWPPNRTAWRDLNDDFSSILHGVGIADLNVPYLILIMSAETPVSRKAFDWEAAERRADWEEGHGRFVEFSNIKDLLSDLHS